MTKKRMKNVKRYYFYFNGSICCNSTTGSSVGSSVSRTVFYIGKSVLTSSNQYATVLVDDFRIYDNVLLTLTDIAQICGNCHFYIYQASTASFVLLNILFNSYIPSITQANATNILT
jgi:hypothetical protein